MTPEKRELMRKALEAADALDTDEYRELCAAAERKAAMEKAAADAEAELSNADFQIPKRGIPGVPGSHPLSGFATLGIDDSIFDSPKVYVGSNAADDGNSPAEIMERAAKVGVAHDPEVFDEYQPKPNGSGI